MDQGQPRPAQDTVSQSGGHFSPARPVIRGPREGVVRRLLLLCIRPESWADMARYPLRYTIWTVILALLVAALFSAIAGGRMFVHELGTFASSYDSRFVALHFAEGKLSAPAGTPVERLPRYDIRGVQVMVDPTGQTKPQDIPDGSALITSDAVYTKYPWGPVRDTGLFDAMKSAGLKTDINSLTLKRLVTDFGGAVGTVWAMAVFGFTLATNALWALIMAFLVSPLVRLATPNLRLPRHMAYRVSAAVTVPLLVLGGVLEIIGHPARLVLGGEGATLFWFFAAAAMAFWGGHLLNRHAIDALRRSRGE